MRPSRLLWAALLAALLSSCGGGGGGQQAVSGPTTSTPTVPQEPGMPAQTGDTATDGYNWFNYRRAQLGLSVLTRNARIDAAAQAHSTYQNLNGSITHDEISGKPGFTGATLTDRLQAAGYTLTGSYAIGEVISATSSTSGAYQAEQLIAAIYHRFVIFSPAFKEMGAGAATASGGNGYTYFTADFTAINGYRLLGLGKFVTYPISNQTGVPTNFFSDSETPDPVPGQNEVGYPVSVHADVTSTVVVQNFSIAPHGGAPLSVRLLSSASDSETKANAAAIVPLAALQSGTTYDVSFTGTVDGVAVTRNWSFTTK